MAGATLVLARTEITIHKDPKFDFTKLKTFAWDPKPGEVKIIVSLEAEKRAEPVKRTYEPVLMKTVDEEMVKRGYAAASGAAPDFLMIYYVLITQGSVSQQMGQFLPANATVGHPALESEHDRVQGLHRRRDRPRRLLARPAPWCWRGVAEAKVDFMKTEDERAKRVRQIMKDLVAKFPKRPAK